MSSDKRFFIVEQIGPKRFRTPDGFMICQDVPIARVGMQMYAPNELPLDEYEFSPAPDGIYRVHRPEEEVFAPEAIISVNGKPVTNEHPKEDVRPDNWRDLSMGHAMHPHRGDGLDDDVLLADLFITDPGIMDDIEAGKREISCGYDVDYFELSPGVLEQRNIRINHVALVQSGRCGARCAIGDSATTSLTTETSKMATKVETRRSLKDRILSCFMKDDKATLARVLDEIEEFDGARARDDQEPGPGVHLHLGGGGHSDEGPPPWFKEHVEGNDKRIRDIEGAVGNLASAFQEWAKGEAKEPEHDDDTTVDDDDDDKHKGKDKKRRRDAKAEGEEEEAEEREEGADDETPPEEIEGQLKVEAPEGSEEHDDDRHARDDDDDDDDDDRRKSKDRRRGKSKDRKRARDSGMLQESFGETLALAEILVPGIAAPKFDPAAKAERTLRDINDLRRKTLDLAYHQAETRSIIENIIGPRRQLRVRDLKALDLRTLFRAAGAAKKAANSAQMRHMTADLLNPSGKPTAPGAIKTLGDYQAMLNKHYAPKA